HYGGSRREREGGGEGKRQKGEGKSQKAKVPEDTGATLTPFCLFPFDFCLLPFALPQKRRHPLQPLAQRLQRGGEGEPEVLLSLPFVPRAEAGAGQERDAGFVKQAVLQRLGVGGA